MCKTQGGIWKGDMLLADFEKPEEMVASEIRAQRLDSKEVILPKSGEEFIFPVADGTMKPCGWRPGTENIHLDTESPKFDEKVKEIFLGESEGY